MTTAADKKNANANVNEAAEAAARAEGEQILKDEATTQAAKATDKNGFMNRIRENKTGAAIGALGVAGGAYAIGKGLQAAYKWYSSRKASAPSSM